MSHLACRRELRTALATFLTLVLLAALPALAGAATFTVNTTADQAPSLSECSGVAGDCGLRQAVDKANTNPGPDTVVVPSGQYLLTIPGAGGDEVGDLNVTEGALSLEGAGARHSIIDATGNESRIFEVEPESALNLSGVTVTGGRTEEGGGGIYVEEATLDLEGVAVTDNESFNASSGGGIDAHDSDVTIRDSTISGNRNSGNGGGINAEGEEEDSLSIENSTVAGNVVDTSLYPGEPDWGAFGGGMEVYTGHFTMRNVTISGNTIHDGNGGESGDGAGINAEPEPGEIISIVNTIVYGNTATMTEATGQCYVTLTSEGHNLEGPEPAGEPRCFETASDLVANPLLGPLADNGGETDTMALTTGSPAVDAGDPDNCPSTDQRGVARPQSAGCDIGAFELVAPVVTPPATVKPITPVPTAAPTLKLKKIKLNLKKGTATILAQVSGPGKLALSGKNVVGANGSASGVQVVKLTVKAKGRSKQALSATGKAKVKVKIAFTPAGGGPPVSRTKSIVLKKKIG
jgi:Right handed beta helix region